MSCGFQGNSDVFGLGIRVGYYTQICALWFSNYFYFREATVLRAVNNNFLLALIFEGSKYIVNASSTYAIEAFILLQIGLVVAIVGITENSRYRTIFRDVSKERLILRILIMLFGAFFNLVFWWKGLDIFLPTPCDKTMGTTVTYAFFFWKADIYGLMWILMKIKAVFVVVLTALCFISSDLAALIYDLRMEKARSAFVDSVNNPIPERGDAVMCLSRLPRSQHPDILDSTQECDAAVYAPKHPILASVSEAEDYLASIYSIYENAPISSEATTPGVRSLASFCAPGKRRGNAKQQQRCIDTTPYLKCLLRFPYGFFTNKPPHTLWTTLCLHEITIGNHPVWQFPRLINRMVSLNAARGSPPAWQFFKIASDLALWQIPAHTTRGVWLRHALWQFLFIVFLIVQVELTIYWNNVSGLQSIFQLGQLIPFNIGVGGLVKVLWGKAKLLNEGCEETLENFQEPSEYELAMAKYLGSKGGTNNQPSPTLEATA